MYGKTSDEAKNLKYDYTNVSFDEWSEVARHSASVFQQVHDEEQNKVTLGQVRETLRWIYNDLRALFPISKFKKKLDKKKQLDQIVDHTRFWKFCVSKLGVEDDSQAAKQRILNKKQQEEKYDGEHSDSDDSDQGLKRTTTEEFHSNRKQSHTGNNITKKK
eukprot:301390_1